MLALLLSGTALAGDDEEGLPFSYAFATSDREVIGTGAVTAAVELSATSPAFGYFPLRISLANSSMAAQEVRLTFTASSGVDGRPITRDVTLERGERRSITLPLPVGSSYGQLRAQGPAINGKRSIHFDAVRWLTTAPPYRAVLALGTPDEFQALVAEAPSYSGASVTVTALAADQAPEELAGYVGFDAVVVTNFPPDELTEARRRALEAYAATGGTLILGRPGRSAPQFFPLLAHENPGLQPYGFGHLRLCGSKCGVALKEDVRLMKPAVLPKGAPPAWARRGARFGGGGQGDPEGTMLPQASAPVGRFLIIMVLFTLAIGPGSFILARRRGPAVLLLSIPGTAAVTCAAIVGYSVLKEGFHTHASTRGFTLLDRAHQRAVTVGVGAFYANVAPGEARFSSTTAVLPPDRQGAVAQPASIDWTQGARFGPDFLPSRTYREWGVVSVEPSRARLVVKRAGGGVSVENALGSHLRAAHFRFGGRDWRVEDVAEGGSGKAWVREMAMPLPGVQVKEFAGRFHPRILEVAKAALGEGEFLAQVEGPSLLPVGGLRLSLHSAEHLIRGQVDR